MGEPRDTTDIDYRGYRERVDDRERAAHERQHEADRAAGRQALEQHLGLHAAEQHAVEVAQASMDRRLESMNEFRDQLREQAASFVRRQDMEAMEQALERRVEELRGLIATEREERRGAEGTRHGLGLSWGILVAIAGMAGGVATLVAMLAGLLR